MAMFSHQVQKAARARQALLQWKHGPVKRYLVGNTLGTFELFDCQKILKEHSFEIF
jgi:hypothetical protein